MYRMEYAEAVAEIVRTERAYDDACTAFIIASERKTEAWQAVRRAKDAGKAIIAARAAELDEATR